MIIGIILSTGAFVTMLLMAKFYLESETQKLVDNFTHNIDLGHYEVERPWAADLQPLEAGEIGDKECEEASEFLKPKLARELEYEVNTRIENSPTFQEVVKIEYDDRIAKIYGKYSKSEELEYDKKIDEIYEKYSNEVGELAYVYIHRVTGELTVHSCHVTTDNNQWENLGEL